MGKRLFLLLLLLPLPSSAQDDLITGKSAYETSRPEKLRKAGDAKVTDDTLLETLRDLDKSVEYSEATLGSIDEAELQTEARRRENALDVLRDDLGRASGSKGVTAVPLVIIGGLELADLALISAISLGILSATQAKPFQDAIEGLIRQIQNAIVEGAHVAGTYVDQLAREASDLKNQISRAVRLAREGVKPRPIPLARTEACKGGPMECCKEFGGAFGDRIQRAGGAWKIYKTATDLRRKLLKNLGCCVEWDWTHGVWEVFNDRGLHMGERSCTDLAENPCTQTGGLDGPIRDGSHDPRGGCRDLLKHKASTRGPGGSLPAVFGLPDAEVGI